MRGFSERFGHILRIEFDSEQNRFVEKIVGDVCPSDYSQEQLQQATATISKFLTRKTPEIRSPDTIRHKRTASR
jgi:predicted HicB family RNase H-like nuclease